VRAASAASSDTGNSLIEAPRSAINATQVGHQRDFLGRVVVVRGERDLALPGDQRHIVDDLPADRPRPIDDPLAHLVFGEMDPIFVVMPLLHRLDVLLDVPVLPLAGGVVGQRNQMNLVGRQHCGQELTSLGHCDLEPHMDQEVG